MTFLSGRWAREGWTAKAILSLQVASVAIVLLLPIVSGPYWRFFVFQMVVVAFLAIGFDLSYSYARILSFMHAVFYAIGAYAAAYLISPAPWALPLVLAVALLGAGLAGALFGIVLVRMENHNPTVATVIIASVGVLAANALSTYTGGDDGLRIVDESIGLAGLQVATGPNLLLFYLAAVPLAAIVVGRQLLQRSLVWTVVRAVADNDVRAAQLGFDVRRRRLVMFVASAMVASLGGAFYALMMRHVSSSVLDIGLSVNAILYTVVGGVGTAFGALLGVLVIYPLTEIISLYFVYVPILVGLLLTFVSLFFPKGILGTLASLGEGGPAAEEPISAAGRADGVARQPSTP